MIKGVVSFVGVDKFKRVTNIYKIILTKKSKCR